MVNGSSSADAFDLLISLIEASGTVVSKDALIDRV
jgi:DNA-binding winged helix-turn-helix (wHTH) protein